MVPPSVRSSYLARSCSSGLTKAGSGSTGWSAVRSVRPLLHGGWWEQVKEYSAAQNYKVHVIALGLRVCNHTCVDYGKER